MSDVPNPVLLLIIFTVVYGIFWFHLAAKRNNFLYFITGWTMIQFVFSVNGFYENTESLPPRLLMFGILPALFIIAIVFLNSKGKIFIDRLNLKTLTNFHAIRIPVEIVLAILFHYGYVSEYMTYHGTNFDILSGLSAPFIAFIAFRGLSVKKELLIVWNIICLLLLLNVVITAIFALPTSFQLLSLEQPNVALLHFPYSMLPTVIVPLVLFAHLAALRQLFLRTDL